MSVFGREQQRRLLTAGLVAIALLSTGAGPGGEVTPSRAADGIVPSGSPGPRFGFGAEFDPGTFRINPPVIEEQPSTGKKPQVLDPRDVTRTAQTVALFGLISLAPVAVLMVTAFVRINIVLVLLRQALGSPQVPGNQVLMALALLLTALVMRPVGERVYSQAIVPYTSGQATPAQAWEAGSGPIKSFMIDQIIKTRHQDYLWSLYDYTAPPSPGQAEPQYRHEFPFRVVAPAYLLSELTTALVMGFYLYLPFLVIDLVVSAVLASMGLYMLPPTLVAMPIKLIVFVLADGWLLVASMLLKSFAVGSP
jgi:flagellar biosynthesis protein FliP